MFTPAFTEQIPSYPPLDPLYGRFASLRMLSLKSEGHFRVPIAHLRKTERRRQSRQRRPRHRAGHARGQGCSARNARSHGFTACTFAVVRLAIPPPTSQPSTSPPTFERLQASTPSSASAAHRAASTLGLPP